MSLDRERRLSLERVYDHISPRELARWQRVSAKTRHVIVAAHYELALTVTVPVKLDRESALHQTPVGAIELENLLAQAMVKVFNQYRESVARALRVDELDAILVGNKAHSFRVDGHHVMNPLGFTGRAVDAVFELTLTTREVFEDWREFFNATNSFFFTELARAELVALQKAGGATPFQLVSIEEDGGAVFILDRAAIGTIMYRSKLEWRADALHTRIGAEWGISNDLARRVYHLTTKGHVSTHVHRSLARAMKPALDDLFARLSKTKLRGVVYVDASLPLPFALPHKIGRLSFDHLPLAPLLQKLGFYTDPSEWPFDAGHSFRRLAPFVEFYYNKGDSGINHWLRRRLHWLAPS